MYYSLSQTSICSLLGHETTLSPNINQSSISQVKMICIYSIIHLPPSLPLTQGSLEEWNMSLGRRGAIGQVKRHPHPSHWELQFLSAPVSHISLEEMQNNFPRAVSLVFCTSLSLFFFPLFCHRLVLLYATEGHPHAAVSKQFLHSHTLQFSGSFHGHSYRLLLTICFPKQPHR